MNYFDVLVTYFNYFLYSLKFEFVFSSFSLLWFIYFHSPDLIITCDCLCLIIGIHAIALQLTKLLTIVWCFGTPAFCFTTFIIVWNCVVIHCSTSVEGIIIMVLSSNCLM